MESFHITVADWDLRESGEPSHQDPKIKEGPGPLLGPTGLS